MIAFTAKLGCTFGGDTFMDSVTVTAQSSVWRRWQTDCFVLQT